MNKVLLFFLIFLLGCSSRIINKNEETFFSYVVMNKKGTNSSDWLNQPAENFPLMRLEKWMDAKK